MSLKKFLHFFKALPLPTANFIFLVIFKLEAKFLRWRQNPLVIIQRLVVVAEMLAAFVSFKNNPKIVVFDFYYG